MRCASRSIKKAGLLIEGGPTPIKSRARSQGARGSEATSTARGVTAEKVRLGADSQVSGGENDGLPLELGGGDDARALHAAKAQVPTSESRPVRRIA